MRSFHNTCAVLGLCFLAGFNAAAAAEKGSISLLDAYAALPSCAQGCLQTALGQSTCGLTNVTCICNDQTLKNAATACITSSCTIKQSLTAKNLTSQLCGVGLPVERDRTLIPLYSTFIGLAVFAVILRLIARVLTQAYFWWDDAANFVGFIGAAAFSAVSIKSVTDGQSIDIWFVPFDDITEVVRLFYWQMILYCVTRFFVRASIILFYMRVFPPKPDQKLGRIVQATFVFNIVYNVSFLFAVIFQCSPLAHFWWQWDGEHAGTCGNANILAWVAAATGIVYDLWLLALPFSQLLTLNLHWKRKLMGGMMFFVGVAVMIISLVRLKTINEFTRAVNPTKDLVQICLWSGIELDVGVICPCLPSFRLLLRRLLPRFMGTTGQRYEMGYHVSNLTGTRKSAGGLGTTNAADGGGGGGVGGGAAGAGAGKITVENRVSIKYASEEGDSSTTTADDARSSSASVTNLVEGRASSGRDEESGPLPPPTGYVHRQGVRHGYAGRGKR
ncbi:uncharacterized protein B0T15DRAFT_495591 [Chaetomium strumarium]|uniref:CFEM domain-containing protein n=1 Tax=Chaetomium strumarium TaxID=1170767 RepID=A0AAJ0GN43_9PEZI|nr:hypothetical protein B0T15DRAFT_495591 [Chaetomium strumarium]